MDSTTGFISDVTGEKRGPKKNYRRFNVITTERATIAGWIFASFDIEDTAAGKVLLQAAHSNRAVRLRGKLTTEEGKKDWQRERFTSPHLYKQFLIALTMFVRRYKKITNQFL
jgi:hypothetical protein